MEGNPNQKLFNLIFFIDKMLKKFLRDAVSLIIGKQYESLADLLHSKKHVNEFIIAKKLDITINQTRNLLYRIADKGIISSIRKKDKKKGWYTYFWRVEVLKALEFLKGDLVSKAGQLSSQINSREVKQFYVCSTCNVEYSEESALLNDFTCPECGNVFAVKDNTKNLRDFKRTLDKIGEEIKVIDVEIGRESAILEKARMKELVKLKKEKAAKLKANREKKKAERVKSFGKPKTNKIADKKSKKIMRQVKKVVNKATKKKSGKKTKTKSKRK